MIILTHIGESLPEYLDVFLQQLRKFNQVIEIIFLVNKTNVDHPIFTNHKIITYPIEHLDDSLINSFIHKFGYGDINSSKRNVIYGSSDYWCVTATRLFYLYEYCKKFNIKEYFHFENDIMIYEDINSIWSIIKENNLCNNVAITRGTNNKIMTGFMYVADNDVMGDILNNFISYLDNKPHLFSYGIDMINEMSLLHIYQIKNPDKLLNLPILPNESLTKNFEFFNLLFDPATYGQYLDGAPGQPGVSILPDSYIGNEMRNNQKISIEFEYMNGLRQPFLIYNDKKIKIATLHIHSKRLNLFIS